ncbi:uncharacterized protein LOC122249692 [Penaeus japonicus]|uniref:uncharacterized protein LOC122249692 n=1 Tax=Penaeus japonicus TaxID=27405 RepID=UPI001C7168C5|nr:uncharacterized protein LOC122249692 [Penaeus japonicus]
MRLKWLLSCLAVILGSGQLVTPAHAQCRCGLFLVTSQEWRPEYLAFTTNQSYRVNCTDAFTGGEECRRYCEEEVLALNKVFATQPHILQEYIPKQDLPCASLPADTSSFYTSCGSDAWYPASAQLSSTVCCDPETRTPVWCESLPPKYPGEPRALGQTPILERKIDTEADPNAIENNEIEGSTKPAAEEDSSAWSWANSVLNFFGYKSVGDLIKNVNIFAIPGKIQAAMKTYNDEISMGQCYMEFTTYSVFSRQDGVFSSLLRTRREMPLSWEEQELGEEEGASFEGVEGAEGRATAPQGQNAAIQNLIGGLVGILESSPTTRQYADVIKQLMPMVMQMYNSEDPTSAITSFITQTLGPYISQIQTAPPKSSNALENDSKPGRWPNLSRPQAPRPQPTQRPRPSSSGSGGSPFTSIILEMVKQYLTAPSPASSASKPQPPPTRAPVAPPAPSSSSSPSGGSSPIGVGNILQLLFGGSSRPQSPARPKPPVKKPQKPPQILEKQDAKSFVEMVLEFIRPVFISIIGKAPGESGVASIREVTRLSSLGRVDDTLVEEVLSPYFCLKNYFVNKAWTLTERGVRSVVSKFNPEEKARMMRMMQEY